MNPAPTAAMVAARKKALELKQKFIEKEAVSPESARTIEELGIRKKGMFYMMLLKKHIIEIEDRYYIDLQVVNNTPMEKLIRFTRTLIGDLTKE